jgi:hypothetical protein
MITLAYEILKVKSQNLQRYGCQTGNKLKEKSRDLSRNSSRFFFK